MPDTTFESLLSAQLRAYAEAGVRPIDRYAIAEGTIAGGRRGGFGERLRGRPSIGRPAVHVAYLLVVLGLIVALALLGAATLAGALLRKPSTVPTSGVSNGWVAFADPHGVRSTEGPSDIYLVKDGVAERPIIGSQGDGLRQVCPSFSPDGTRLAYSEAQIGNENSTPYDIAAVIVTVNAAGAPVGPELRLATPSSDVRDACPKWAPDGRSVTFLTTATGQPPELWIGHLDGTETQVAGWDAIRGGGSALDLPYDSNLFDWSPDGTAVVAVADDETSLWIVPVDGGAPRLLRRAAPGVHFHSVQWSPDGARIVAESYTDPSGSDSVGAIEIYQADGPGSPIELAGVDTSDPTWSPDGREIAYLEDHPSGPPDIVAVTLDTGEVRRITSDPNGYVGLVWAPDGTRLVYANSNPAALVSVSVVGDSAPIVLTHNFPFDLEYTGASNISWQPVFP